MEHETDSESIEVRLFLEAIYARYGYDLRGYSRASIKRRVLSALARSGCANLGELQHEVLSDSDMFAEVIDQLTVQVSDLFRDPDMYRAFWNGILPVLRTYPLLKIWHAGCAAGEEAYASAIMLTEAGLYDRAQIYATDLSPKALDRAKCGVYPMNRVSEFAANYRASGGHRDFASYYTQAYDHIALNEALRRNIVFFQHDLVSDHVFGEMHVIFCRNVFIYFNSDLRERVVRKFSQSLCAGGFLCLGKSEQLTKGETTRSFQPFAADERIYRYAPLRS